MYFNTYANYESLAMVEATTRLKRLSSTGQPQETFIYACISEFENSDELAMMKKAQKYYGNDNDINERKRYYIDRKGIKQEVTNLSNTRLPHPYLKKLTNQKVNYLLGKELTIQCDNDKFGEELGKYIGRTFLSILKNTGKNAILNGISWIQPYYNREGNLKFKRMPSEEVIPFWADADHTELDGVIRYYTMFEYDVDGNKKEVVKVEYHTVEGVWYYVKGDKGLEPDLDVNPSGEVRGHFIVTNPAADEDGKLKLDENGNQVFANEQATWERIPFIAFKYNQDEISLLKWVKPLIDDYDINTSDTSNTLQDVPNSIKVVKNYDGTDKGEFVQNLATFRTAFVSGDGDMTTVENKLDIAAIDSHLDRLRKDIYESGSGVDTQVEDLGNASGVALKFRYADLDNDMQDMANEFSSSLENLIWFIKVDMLNKGIGDFMNEEYEIVFNTDNITNESETITNCKDSAGIISDETILANHPWVTDAAKEMDRLKKEREEMLSEDEDEDEDEFGFGNENQNEDD
jgi:SPP1 family phage portal protein